MDSVERIISYSIWFRIQGMSGAAYFLNSQMNRNATEVKRGLDLLHREFI